MKQRFGFIIVFSFLSFSLHAQFLGIGKKHTSSTEKYSSHRVQQGETLFSISKTYHTTVGDLKRINPSIVSSNLEVGSKIKVPYVPKSILKEDARREKMMENAILYTVKKKETLYSIAKRNNTDVETIMKWNNLQVENVQEGQQIIVGFKNPGDKKVTDETSNASANKTNESEMKTKSDVAMDANTEADVKTKNSAAMITQQGAAIWIKDVDDNGGLYALHPTAPIGSEIIVRNLMNNKTVTVKVIGKLPATSENQNILIKLSASAARELGVLDEKFQVQLSYPQE